MEDLATLEGKTIEELRQIATVLGISGEKLSKRSIIAKIKAVAEVDAEPAKSELVEAAAEQPKRRGRRPRVAEKVEVVAEPVASEPVKQDAQEQDAQKVETKRRGRPKKAAKVANKEVVTEPETGLEAAEAKAEPEVEPEITKDDFTAEVIGEGVLELIPEGYGFLRRRRGRCGRCYAGRCRTAARGIPCSYRR
ncbi:MAG: hypothetical protein IIX42_04095 [Alistipes sp.]|nr:hypothetical protein [Alistipes sp.]